MSSRMEDVPTHAPFKRPRSPLERVSDIHTYPDEDDVESWHRSKRYLAQVVSQGLSKLTFVNSGPTPERSPRSFYSRSLATPSPDASDREMQIDAQSPVTSSPQGTPHSLGRRILTFKRRSLTQIPQSGDLASPTSPSGTRLPPTASSSLRLELQLPGPADVLAAPTDLRKATLLKALLVKADEELRCPVSPTAAPPSNFWPGDAPGTAPTAGSAAATARCSTAAPAVGFGSGATAAACRLAGPSTAEAAVRGPRDLPSAPVFSCAAAPPPLDAMDATSDLLSPSDGHSMSEGMSCSSASGPPSHSNPQLSNVSLHTPFSPLPLASVHSSGVGAAKGGGLSLSLLTMLGQPLSAAAAARGGALGQLPVGRLLLQPAAAAQQQPPMQAGGGGTAAAAAATGPVPSGGSKPPLPSRPPPSVDLSRELLERLRVKALLGAAQLAAEAQEEATFRPRRLQSSRSTGGAVDASLSGCDGAGGAAAGGECKSGLPSSPRRHSSHL